MTTETTVKNLIVLAQASANMVEYHKDQSIHFGRIVSNNPRKPFVYRLMRSVGGDTKEIVDLEDGEQLLHDAFMNVEAMGMKLFIVVNGKVMPY